MICEWATCRAGKITQRPTAAVSSGSTRQAPCGLAQKVQDGLVQDGLRQSLNPPVQMRLPIRHGLGFDSRA